MFEKIGDMVYDEHVPTQNEWLQISNFMAKMLHIRQGHRVQWVEMFTMEKYYSLLEDRDCRTPYQGISEGTKAL